MKEIDMKTAMELSGPYSMALVVMVDKNGKPNARAVTWWTFTSYQPPMLAIAIVKTGYSPECLEESKEFVLCLPSRGQEKATWLCGSKSGRDTDKFQEAGLTAIPSKVVRPPIIEGSTAAYECKIVQQLDCGDCTLYNAEIAAMYADFDRLEHIMSMI
ncbi:Flavoredoxin [subsurface metagenome]